MNEIKKTNLKSYETPETKRTQVELEEGVCATSATGTPVTGDNTKVKISEQEHGGWDGTGDDISATWE